jgi:microcompartment protein CcmL/EutN
VNPPEALSLIEFDSVAIGTRAVDALMKKAPVSVERMGTVQPGKLVVLFSGDVASVEASHHEALAVAGRAVLDRVLLPHVDPQVFAAVSGSRGEFRGDSLGIIETATLAAVVDAADAAVKGALVAVVSIRLADGLGGKGMAHFVGEQHDVEAAIDLGCARAATHGAAVQSSITRRIEAELLERLEASTRFWGDGRGAHGGTG